MRPFLRPILLGLAVLPCMIGCNSLGIFKTVSNPTPQPPKQQPDREPDVASLVNYLNLNAQRVQNVRGKVDIQCKMGIKSIGLDGQLACQKPRDFRLKASLFGQPAVDMGSNEQEFWYWISKDSPPHVYHCSYNDLSSGKVRVPFPFHPDLVVSALGIGEYDPKAKYELRASRNSKSVELVEDAVALTGQRVRKVTVFNRYMAAPGQPQVLGHMLMDDKGQMICKATVHRVINDRATGATLPSSVTIEWPAQNLSMKLSMSDIQANAIEKTTASNMFQRSGLVGHSTFDLARGVVDTPGGLQRASGVQPFRR